MKNLFDYATKELSQDAFLRWLFENYNCENESVRNSFRKLFDSFTDNKFVDKTITDLITVAQWKNIDISIWFKVDEEEHLIVIEDKTGSGIHDNQLNTYAAEINGHNGYWLEKENSGYARCPRFVKEDSKIFKIFYKTNIVNQWERNATQNDELGKWKCYDVYSIYELFKDIKTDNEVLGYYIEYIKKIYSYAKRETNPSEWELISWHSFFNDYQAPDCISSIKEINCYQKEYYYIKLFVKGQENDLPCFEIRSRDFAFNTNTEKYSITIRAVLYNLENQATKEAISNWQELLKSHGFDLNYRKDTSKHKQIATITIDDIENNEKDIFNALNKTSELLSKIFY